MPYQATLFEDLPPADAQGGTVPGVASESVPSAPGAAVVTVASLRFDAPGLSAGQQRFNRLLARNETLARRMAALQTMADVYRRAHARQVYPLERKRDDLMREMVHLLDERLHRSGLSRTQQRQARDILCSLAAPFAQDGDETMRVLHDAHGERSFDECQRAQAQATQEFLEDVLGQDFDDAVDFSDPEAVLRASMEQMQRAAQAAQEAREATQSRRAKRARPSKAQAQAQDADTALRAIFRQLASALHPDRETDPVERARKTALMSEANAAYGRRDLLALLQLQLRAELVDGPAVTRLAEEKLAALTVLLKERADRLQCELADAERQLRIEFALGSYGTITELVLRRHIAAQQSAVQYEIEQMQRDLRTVRDDAALKRWLREQTRLARDPF